MRTIESTIGTVPYETSKYLVDIILCEKCPNTEFFWSVFSRIGTEYGDLLRKSPYSFPIRDNTDQKKLRI